MLGKLLKHEFKATGRIIPLIYLGMAAFFLLGLFAKLAKIDFLRGTTSVFLVIGGVACIIVTYVVIISRYHKNLFGNEGYLTQTLPVSKASILASKAIAAFVWLILSMVFMALSFLGMFYLLDLKDIWNELSKLLTQDLKDIIFRTVIFGFGAMFIQLLLFISEIYFAITLANTKLFIKNNILFSFVGYLLINLVGGFLEMVGIMLVPFSYNIQTRSIEYRSMIFELTKKSPTIIGFGSVIMDLLICVGLFVATNYILKHKVSVK